MVDPYLLVTHAKVSRIGVNWELIIEDLPGLVGGLGKRTSLREVWTHITTDLGKFW